jgi:hypothetical protein
MRKKPRDWRTFAFSKKAMFAENLMTAAAPALCSKVRIRRKEGNRVDPDPLYEVQTLCRPQESCKDDFLRAQMFAAGFFAASDPKDYR